MRAGIFTAIIFMVSSVFAQSPDPVITGDTMLCPNESGTLSTQQMYDSYQWYQKGYFDTVWTKFSGNGQQQTIQINDTLVLNYFKVEVVANGDTGESDAVLLDQWAFLPPTVSSQGDFEVGPQGEALLCQDDTMFFVLQSPYDTNITWYHDNNIIPGMNNDTLYPESSGFYTVAGAPSKCPNYIQQLGTSIEVIRFTAKAPDIIQTNDTLQVMEADSFASFTWYRNGQKINGATDSILIPSSQGDYYVKTEDKNGCTDTSNTITFNPTGIEQPGSKGLSIYPNPAQDKLMVEGNVEPSWTYSIYDVNGKAMLKGQLNGKPQIDVARLDTGIYLLQLYKADKTVNIKLVKE